MGAQPRGRRGRADGHVAGPAGAYRLAAATTLRKVAGPAIAASYLGPVDTVLLNHDQHGDNLDGGGRAVLASAASVVTTVGGARRLGGRARGLGPWSTTRFDAPGQAPIEITATPCRHGPPLSRWLAGDAIGFALRWPGQGGGVLWISGDTVLHRGVREVARRLVVDAALVHVGGVRFPITGPLRYTMTARDAVELCRLMRPRVLVPVHYEGWTRFRQGRAAIERELASAPADVRRRVRWLPIGEGVDLGATEPDRDASRTSGARTAPR